MIRVSAPSTPLTFTSAQSYDSTFRLDIQGDTSEYDMLRVEGDLKDYDESETGGDLNNIVTIQNINSALEIPCGMYLTNSNRVQPSFDVYRGPQHPQEITLFEVELTVYGIPDKSDKDETERIGSDTVKLRG